LFRLLTAGLIASLLLSVFATTVSADTGASGRLTLALEGWSCALTFRKGVLEHVTSTRPGDDLASFLVTRGVVKAAQVAEATLGEISDALRDVFGEYRETVVL
jgi:hypothetical protein